MTTTIISRTALAKPVSIGAATLATGLVWLGARTMDIDFNVIQQNGQATTVGLPQVLGFTLAASLLGWAALTALERFTRRGKLWWTALALAVLALSLLPLTGAEGETSTKVALALMHTTVAAILIPAWTSGRS